MRQQHIVKRYNAIISVLSEAYREDPEQRLSAATIRDRVRKHGAGYCTNQQAKKAADDLYSEHPTRIEVAYNKQSSATYRLISPFPESEPWDTRGAAPTRGAYLDAFEILIRKVRPDDRDYFDSIARHEKALMKELFDLRTGVLNAAG